jgi:hypothetical protein
VVVVAGNREYLNNVVVLFGKRSGLPAYHAFFAPELFKQIAGYIGKEKSSYRVLNVGLHPAIAQYNGFYTSDSYQNNYPLSYKHAFRKVIQPELEKNERLRRYFDHWGSKCYAFSAELNGNNLIGKSNKQIVEYLQFSLAALKKMKISYIFSTVEIRHPSKGIRFERKFMYPTAYYDIYLYQVK